MRSRRVAVCLLWLLSACVGLPINPTESPAAVKPATSTSTTTPLIVSTLPPTTIKPTESLESPSGRAVSITQIVDMSFVDTATVWLLAAACTEGNCPVTLRVTHDGGSTWQKPAAPHAKTGFFPSGPVEPSDLPEAGSIRFATALDGWIFGPSLYATRDGGQTWTDEQRLLLDLQPTDGVIWAIEQKDNEPRILRSVDGGQTWPQVEQPPKPMDWPAPTLVGMDRNTAWLYTQNGETLEPKSFITRDGGNSWQELPAPTVGCPTYAASMSFDRHLWFVCGGSPATDMQDKRIYISSDDGSSWELGGDTAKPNTQGGGIGYIGSSKYFAAISASSAFMALARSTLMLTTDRGFHWRDAIPYEEANGGWDPAIGPVRFVDAKRGCMAAGPNRLFCTANGGMTWDMSVVP